MYGNNARLMFETLVADGIRNSTGVIRFELMGTSLDIDDKSAVGTLLQEWLGAWMTSKGIYHRVQDNSQVFPDFFLGEDNHFELLEIKSFDYTKSPNFDIANFDTYTRSIAEAAYRLEADYLIFGYELTGTVLTIRDIWLKKVWEITCAADQYAVRTQVKQGVIYNIRPYNFKANNTGRGFNHFSSRREFVEALQATIIKYTPERDAAEWLTNVEESYATYYPSESL